LRVRRLKREAAAYIILRRKGVSINQISSFFGRSRSFVFRILKAAHVPWKDLRKLPASIRLLSASRVGYLMKKLLAAWEAFILGEVEKPP